jgi:hypothetical protein
VTQPVDSSILHEIVRVIESRRRVPEKVIVKSREYLLTYLEDHQRRLEEALQRYDADRLNMLYGQLASKIKYQLLRRLSARQAAAALRAATRAPTAKKPAKPPPKAAKKPAKPPPKAAKKPAAKPKKAVAAKKKRAAPKRSKSRARQAAGRRR